MSFKNASEYVISFISKYGDDDLLNKWNNNDFKKIFKEKKTKVDGPNKNKSAYIFFCDEERQRLKTENLSLTNKEVISELASRWRLIKDHPDKVEKYTLLAKEDKDRYATEIKNYVSPVENKNDDTDTSKKKSKKIKKEKTDIKKNKSSYLFFCEEERVKMKKENLELSNNEIISELGNRWKKIKDDPKKIEKFVKLAENDKKRYESEKKQPTVAIETHSEDILDEEVQEPEIEEEVEEEVVVEKKPVTKKKNPLKKVSKK